MLVAAKSCLKSRDGSVAVTVLCVVALALTAPPVRADDFLQQLDKSVEALTRQVSPAVVQILVTGYAAVDQHGRTDTALIGRQRSLGSGFIVDPEGYIITNAHVVEGAVKVRVVLFSSENSVSPHATLRSRPTTMDARVVGVHAETDLALLKIEASGLPSLPFRQIPGRSPGPNGIRLRKPRRA